MSNVKTALTETKQESDLKTEKLNTAYYAIGTAKELIKQNVLTKDGGFIGLGKSTKLKANFNTAYFTKVDVTTLKEITIGSKKAKVISTNPADSYSFEGEQGKKITNLLINDPAAFWATDRYLVIVTE